MTGDHVAVVTTDAEGLVLLRRHPRYTVVFSARCGTQRPTAASPPPQRQGGPVALLLTYSEVAEQLAISERKVRSLVKVGALPAVAIDGARRIRRVDVDQYVENLGSEAA